MLTARFHNTHSIPETRNERAGRYRREARRLRSKAQAIHDAELRQQLLNIASQYELLAATLEAVLG